MKVKELLEILKSANSDEDVIVKTKSGYHEIVEACRYSLPGSYIADLMLFTEPA